MFTLEELKETFAREKSDILEEYFTFLRFASIATDPDYQEDVRACADWLAAYLEGIGLEVEQWEVGEGAPTVFARDLRAGPKAETVLLYCHYDVQPVDPLELWTTPPFEPTVREENVFARGAVDNKGQCFYTLRALKTLLARGPLKVNLKLIIEGEEESGSHSLNALLGEKKDELKADHLLIVDSGLEEPGEPVICLGARGMCCLNVTLRGSHTDLHSGLVGGIAYNPNRALVELLSKLYDNQGFVSIPGFYDEMVELPPAEKEVFKLDLNTDQLERDLGLKAAGNAPPGEAVALRPTLEINGISGGYAGPGFKTVIPAVATAKLSCRLVPHQHPDHIAELIKNFLLSNTPPEMDIEVEVLPGHGFGFRSNPHSRLADVMSTAYSTVFGKPCQRILLGGSIPIAADLAQAAGAETVLVGVGLNTDQIHAPNEHFGIDRFEQGYLTIAHGLELLGEK